ncbi:class I SAM-dependent methyltransferase [Dyadobacter psychrotolerans]|uniref:Class I SAM-dependent methyltransferase n=1 Tax=Dyadobacter psychrotolerans TaxID=2541721 RepID=A0A4R5E0U1_9BACT|nr:class I SAM-dependent methyltransferase [Dyadobacter psychrotolerans]TDE17243.1 class I SAM-dependent methyltransferase [Dyadobacter psychrotolerans]
MQLSENIKESYSAQYDADSVQWRNTGAKYKAENIVALAKHINFKNVLEVGAGEGSILNWLSKWNFSTDLNCVEISESGIELIKSKNIANLKDILLFDGYRIPYADDHFDLVICSHVLEHVEHERILLREIKRVSKHQIFEVPIDFSFYVDKKLKHFLGYGHINIYTPSLFRFLLKSENFEVKKDISYLYPDEVLLPTFKNYKMGFYLTKIKHFILRMFPYLLGIKPNSYAVLTSKSNQEISIF